MTPSPHTPAQERLLRLREEKKGALLEERRLREGTQAAALDPRSKTKQDKNKPPSRIKTAVQDRLLKEQAQNQGEPGKGKRSRHKPPPMCRPCEDSDDDDEQPYRPRDQRMAVYGAEAREVLAAAAAEFVGKATDPSDGDAVMLQV